MKSRRGKSSPPASGLRRFNEWLEKLSLAVTLWTGSSLAFAIAVAVVAIWAVTGPMFNYSETWQLVINTGTTIVTFLMVFLIQRSQNKESLAVQVKLNELLAAQEGASNRLINVEDWSEEDITRLHKRFEALSHRLEDAADTCNSHSVSEAREALIEAEETLDTAVQNTPGEGRSRPAPSKPR
jgi:low affinity Fe/Cu permease